MITILTTAVDYHLLLHLQGFKFISSSIPIYYTFNFILNTCILLFIIIRNSKYYYYSYKYLNYIRGKILEFGLIMNLTILLLEFKCTIQYYSLLYLDSIRGGGAKQSTARFYSLSNLNNSVIINNLIYRYCYKLSFNIDYCKIA